LRGRRLFNDEKERRKWQNPEAILVDIGVRPGIIFVDLGCSDGFFALHAARLVGEEGRVLGLDADPEAIRRLRQRALKENLINLKVETGMAEERFLCDSCADLVFLGIVLHDFIDPRRVLSNAKMMLKPTSRLVDLDWKKEPMQLGPPLKIRFDENKASELIKSAGFEIGEIKKQGAYQYLILATPKP